MAHTLYKPFKKLEFKNKNCFLSGVTIQADEQISVFPEWLIAQFQLAQKPFKLLDESMATYGVIKVPCSAGIAKYTLEPLEHEIQKAFNIGYEAVKNLSSLQLFQWIGKLVYGIIYNELRIGIREQQAGGEDFLLAEGLMYKFGNLQLMLQSLIQPMQFEERPPWTIQIFKVENSPEVFNFRDEINTLTFSLAMNDFGIIACLQDNGSNAIYHEETLLKVKDKTLKPIQFEELIARFYYSNYLFNRLPEYNVLPANDVVYIEAMPLRGLSNKPLFDNWQAKPYGQVLENFWKPWGFTLFEIIKDPENPMSFLFDE
ncbi:MAG: hypothetical protein H7096_10770 [Flavobacterium sp.]|nr:hypothetical protein [Pedobacter sp.]